MSWNHERGSVLAADLLLGCAIVIVLASAASAAGLIIDAEESSAEAAQSAAVAIARGWQPSDALARAQILAPAGSSITSRQSDGNAVVVVSLTVALPHPIARRVTTSVEATSSVPIAPYRSRRDG